MLKSHQVNENAVLHRQSTTSLLRTYYPSIGRGLCIVVALVAVDTYLLTSLVMCLASNHGIAFVLRLGPTRPVSNFWG